MAVFVLDQQKQPLMPCSEKRARLLLARGRAVVHKRYPFTLRLKDRIGGDTQPLRLGIDPGSKVTGLSLMRESDGEQRHVLCLFELAHRGYQMTDFIFPSDADRAENEDLDRVCQYAEELIDQLLAPCVK